MSHRRSAPAKSTPIVKALRHDHEQAEQHEAAQHAQEREERPELAAHQVAPDQREVFHAWPSIKTPFSRCSVRVARSGRARVMRHHDDRLAMLSIKRLQQIEDLVTGLAIEVARGLVAEQQRRVGHDRTRDADALVPGRPTVAADSVSIGRPVPTTLSATFARLRRSADDKFVSSSGSSTLRSAVKTGNRL